MLSAITPPWRLPPLPQLHWVDRCDAHRLCGDEFGWSAFLVPFLFVSQEHSFCGGTCSTLSLMWRQLLEESGLHQRL